MGKGMYKNMDISYDSYALAIFTQTITWIGWEVFASITTINPLVCLFRTELTHYYRNPSASFKSIS